MNTTTNTRLCSFTSESVGQGHPDKIADQVSDAVLDAILAEDPHGRVACETMVTTGLCVIAGEITTDAYVEIPKIARETINNIGYDNALYGFDGNTCGAIVSIDEQSPDIAQGVDVSEEVRTGQSGEDRIEAQGAGEDAGARQAAGDLEGGDDEERAGHGVERVAPGGEQHAEQGCLGAQEGEGRGVSAAVGDVALGGQQGGLA